MRPGEMMVQGEGSPACMMDSIPADPYNAATSPNRMLST